MFWLVLFDITFFLFHHIFVIADDVNALESNDSDKDVADLTSSAPKSSRNIWGAVQYLHLARTAAKEQLWYEEEKINTGKAWRQAQFREWKDSNDPKKIQLSSKKPTEKGSSKSYFLYLVLIFFRCQALQRLQAFLYMKILETSFRTKLTRTQ